MRTLSKPLKVFLVFAGCIAGTAIAYDIWIWVQPAKLVEKLLPIGIPIVLIGLAFWVYYRSDYISLPPATRKGLFGSTISLLSCIAILSLLTRANVLPGPGALSNGIMLGPLFLFGLYWIISAGKMRRKVMKFNYSCCLFCTYSLTGLPGEGKCPECGNEYRIDDCYTKWRHWAKGVW